MDKELIDFLIAREYAVVLQGKPILTKKFKDLFTLDTPVTVDKSPPPLVVQTTDKRKEIWTKFVADAKIPWRVKNPEGQTYTVNQFGLAGVNKLIAIINSGVDYERLCKSTAHYYVTISYKTTLQNYLIKDIWKGEYDNYKIGQKQQSNDGSSPWEEL